VRLDPDGWHSLTKESLQALVAEGRGGETLASALDGETIPPLYPDHPLDTALRYVDRWPLVPVVHRANHMQLEGVLTAREVLARYRDFGEEE